MICIAEKRGNVLQKDFQLEEESDQMAGSQIIHASIKNQLSGPCQLAFVVGLFVLLLPFSLLDDDGENKESTPPLPEMEEGAVNEVNPLSLQRF